MSDDKARFNERCERPIAGVYMTEHEINEYKKVLVQSYHGLQEKDIFWKFQKIPDGDGDADDCILLKYFTTAVKTSDNRDIKERCIFTMKMPLPESVKEKARQARRKHAQEGTSNGRTRKQRGQRLAIEAPDDGPRPVITDATDIATASTVTNSNTSTTNTNPITPQPTIQPTPQPTPVYQPPQSTSGIKPAKPVTIPLAGGKKSAKRAFPKGV